MPKPKTLAASGREALRAARRERRDFFDERREKFFEMLINGFTHAEIAQLCGVTVKTVRRVVDRALDERAHASPQRYASLQLARLDKAMLVVGGAMDRCELAAVPMLIQLQAQYDRYEGLSARLLGAEQNLDTGHVSAPKPRKSLTRVDDLEIAAEAGSMPATGAF